MFFLVKITIKFRWNPWMNVNKETILKFLEALRTILKLKLFRNFDQELYEFFFFVSDWRITCPHLTCKSMETYIVGDFFDVCPIAYTPPFTACLIKIKWLHWKSKRCFFFLPCDKLFKIKIINLSSV